MKKNPDEILTDIHVKLNKVQNNEFPYHIDKQILNLKDYLGKYRNFSSDEAALFTLKTINLVIARYHCEKRHSLLGSRPFSLVVDPCGACNLNVWTSWPTRPFRIASYVRTDKLRFKTPIMYEII